MADPRGPAISCDQLAVPAALESPRSKLLHVVLAVTCGARPPELRSALGMSSLGLSPTIRDLQEAGVVERVDDGVVRSADAAAAKMGAR